MTDRSDERLLVVMSDVLLCLKPLTRNSSTVMYVHYDIQLLLRFYVGLLGRVPNYNQSEKVPLFYRFY